MTDKIYRKFEEERLTFRTNILLRQDEADFVKNVLMAPVNGKKPSFNSALRLLINEKKNSQPQKPENTNATKTSPPTSNRHKTR